MFLIIPDGWLRDMLPAHHPRGLKYGIAFEPSEGHPDLLGSGTQAWRMSDGGIALQRGRYSKDSRLRKRAVFEGKLELGSR